MFVFGVSRWMKVYYVGEKGYRVVLVKLEKLEYINGESSDLVFSVKKEFLVIETVLILLLIDID